MENRQIFFLNAYSIQSVLNVNKRILFSILYLQIEFVPWLRESDILTL